MLGKLYKHEFYSLFRNLTPVYAALALFTVMCKLSQLIKIEGVVYEILSGFSTMFYVISIFAMFIVGMVIIIIRFYKNLLSHEGYLTFSLPFTATGHVICKLICAVVMNILNFIAVIISLLLVGLGTETMDEIFYTLRLMIEDVAANESVLSIVLFCIEILVMVIASLFQSTLMYYAAMALGQQFKSKIGGSVLAYIALYVATETITSIAIVPVILVFGEAIDNYLNTEIFAIQLLFLFAIILSAVYATVYFLITRYFLTKKLNLE